MKKESHRPNPILEDELGLSEEKIQAVSTNKERDSISDEKKNTKLEQAKSRHQPDGADWDQKKPWYSRPHSLAIIGLLVIVIAVVIIGLVGWRNRSAADEFIADEWRGIVQQADRATQAADKAEYNNMSDTTRELSDLADKIGDVEARSTKQNTWFAFGNRLGAFRDVLLDLKDYAGALQASAGNLKDQKPKDLDALQATGSSAESKLESKKSLLHLSDTMPSGFFKLSERFGAIITAHDKAETEKQAAEDDTRSKEEQAKQNQADAEEAVSRWTTAYKANDVAEMKRWMTAAYTKEYDFSEVTSSYRLTNYPVSYRRISTEKKGDQFEIVEAITFVTKSDYSADTNYTQTFVFLVSQDATSKRWLVNSRRYSY